MSFLNQPPLVESLGEVFICKILFVINLLKKGGKLMIDDIDPIFIKKSVFPEVGK